MDQMNLAQLSPMSADETAALLFICGDQYLFRYRTKDSGVAYKFVSPASVRAAFGEEAIDTGWLPPNTRRWGIGRQGEWILLTYPPQQHRFTFAREEGVEKTITLEIPMPSLAFFGYDRRYYLWAFKDAELKGDTALFAAPLPNIDSNGSICFGTNKMPRAAGKAIGEAWRIFLASPFTEHSVNGKSRGFPDDVRKQLVQLAEHRRRRYPIEDLASLNRTANMMVDWTLRGVG